MTTVSAQPVVPSEDVTAQADVVAVTVKTKDPTDKLAAHILLYSFAVAVLLAIAGFVVVTIYLFSYLNHATRTFNPDALKQLSGMSADSMMPILAAQTGLWKFILQSCGIIAGAAFGFLGFALFLLGAKGDMDAAFDDSQHKVQLSRMAPGSFVLLIAAVLIGLCAINKVQITFPGSTTTTTTTIPNGTGRNNLTQQNESNTQGGQSPGQTDSTPVIPHAKPPTL